MTADQLSPYAIYYFFRSFRNSLPDENDFEDFISTLTVTPLHAIIENVLPFFRRSADPGLFTKFQLMVRQCEQNSDFRSTLMRVCDAFDMLQRVERALRNNQRLMNGYLRAMQFDNDSASHQQVWAGLQHFLNEECDSYTKQKMERVFAEQKASDELGLHDDVLSVANSLIGDDALYIEILETLQLNNRQNLPWDTVVNRIRHITTEKKPQIWPRLSKFLDDLHNGQVDFSYPIYWEEDEEEVNEPEYEINILEQKFSNVNIGIENRVVKSQPQQEQQKEIVEAI